MRGIFKVLLVLVAALMSGCEADEPIETFPLSQCSSAPTEVTRTRRVQTTCAFRQGGNVYNPAKICLMWNHRTVHETQYTVTCSKAEWRSTP